MTRASQHGDPDVWKCPICGHFDPHTKNGGCGADIMIEGEPAAIESVVRGAPPKFLQCMCGTDLYLTPERIAGREPFGRWWKTTDE